MAGALPILALPSGATAGGGAPRVPGAASRWFTTSDGQRLHYLEAGPRLGATSKAPTLVFVPGWTMPAWIWQAQIEHFAERHRVLAFDPRGQGRSAIATAGYDYARRAADIAELLAAAGTGDNVVLVAWSLGVLESLQFMHDARAAGRAAPVRALVLVDNSVGVGDPPAADPTFFPRLRARRRATVAGFCASMFKRRPEPRWLDELVADALRMSLDASITLLAQPRPREFWRDALYATAQPVLYAHTPKFAQQGEIVRARMPHLESALFADAGHALFVDDAARFNETMERFLEAALAAPAPGRPAR
ncbi:MAG: alpha/beta fold hydrolase [Rubrivivax sp.]|nr:alpha/beta fold hydrolase [Rubrivivax sp.]